MNPPFEVEIVRFPMQGETVRIGSETIELSPDQLVIEATDVYAAERYLQGHRGLDETVYEVLPIEGREEDGGNIVIVTVHGNVYYALERLRDALNPQVRYTAQVTMASGPVVGSIIIDFDEKLSNRLELPNTPQGVTDVTLDDNRCQITVRPNGHSRHRPDLLYHILEVWLREVGVRLTL